MTCQPSPLTLGPLTLPSPQRGEGFRLEGFAAVAVVAVEFAARVDGHANGGLGAHGLEVVPAGLGAEDEVAGLRADGRGLVLDIPVDLALEHHPPLVVKMI